jgi:hypothetical protein
MRQVLFAAALIGALVATRGEARAALEVGDLAPEFVGKEFINTEPCSFKTLRGHAVLVEIFRTW